MMVFYFLFVYSVGKAMSEKLPEPENVIEPKSAPEILPPESKEPLGALPKPEPVIIDAKLEEKKREEALAEMKADIDREEDEEHAATAAGTALVHVSTASPTTALAVVKKEEKAPDK